MAFLTSNNHIYDIKNEHCY